MKHLQTVYSRDTAYPVHVIRQDRGNDSYNSLLKSEIVYLLDRGGQVSTYGSARQLLLALGSHPTWTFDRYFRQGRWRPRQFRGVPIKPLTDLLEVKPAPPVRGRRISPVRLAQSVLGNHTLGIDLVHRADEVAKLLFSGFGPWIYGSKYDPEDVLQEVYKGILARNQGKCPWDPCKASFGHYVHRVCFCVLSNYHRKQYHRIRVEQVGLKTFGSDHQLGNQDISDVPNLKAPVTSYEEQCKVKEAQESLQAFVRGHGSELAAQLVPLVYAGYTRSEIAQHMDVSLRKITSATSELKQLSAQWRP